MYSENATKSSEISTVDLTVTTLDKSKVEISQKIMAFSEYMNFTLVAWLYLKKILTEKFCSRKNTI